MRGIYLNTAAAANLLPQTRNQIHCKLAGCVTTLWATISRFTFRPCLVNVVN